MPVIVFAARKGGVGKTCLTASMAVLACQAANGLPGDDQPDHGGVAIVDFDSQGSLTEWRNCRTAPYPALAQLDPAGLKPGLAKLRAQKFQMVLIDTPPGHGDVVVASMAVADAVIIPIKPGQHDLQAALNTVAIAESLGRPFALLPNDSTYRSIAMGATIRLLREAELPLLPTIHHRVDTMLADGRTATERAPMSRAAAELAAAWAEIVLMLNERRRRR